MKEINLYPQAENIGTRIDVYLSEELDITRSRINSIIKDEKVFFNNTLITKSGFKIKAGEIKLFFEEPKELDAKPQNIPIDIIYEDSDIAVVNKPQGMVTHPAKGSPDNTLVNALLYHIKDL
ncbi:MAG: RNA pseudouridine synthase, partial [Bacteroidota bacterium]